VSLRSPADEALSRLRCVQRQYCARHWTNASRHWTQATVLTQLCLNAGGVNVTHDRLAARVNADIDHDGAR
jgi:hypothetical protein